MKIEREDEKRSTNKLTHLLVHAPWGTTARLRNCPVSKTVVWSRPPRPQWSVDERKVTGRRSLSLVGHSVAPVVEVKRVDTTCDARSKPPEEHRVLVDGQ